MQPTPSVYNLGAKDGLIMGIYLSVIFLSQAIGQNVLPLLLLGEVMLIGIPILSYWLIRSGDRRLGAATSFSANWLHGIVFFLCGGLIMALVTYLYLRLLDPTFILEQIKMAAEVYRSLGTPEAEHMAKQFEGLINNNLMPSPIQFAFSLIWVCGFFGSIISLIESAIISLFRNKRKPTIR